MMRASPPSVVTGRRGFGARPASLATAVAPVAGPTTRVTMELAQPLKTGVPTITTTQTPPRRVRQSTPITMGERGPTGGGGASAAATPACARLGKEKAAAAAAATTVVPTATAAAAAPRGADDVELDGSFLRRAKSHSPITFKQTQAQTPKAQPANAPSPLKRWAVARETVVEAGRRLGDANTRAAAAAAAAKAEASFDRVWATPTTAPTPGAATATTAAAAASGGAVVVEPAVLAARDAAVDALVAAAAALRERYELGEAQVAAAAAVAELDADARTQTTPARTPKVEATMAALADGVASAGERGSAGEQSNATNDNSTSFRSTSFLSRRQPQTPSARAAAVGAADGAAAADAADADVADADAFFLPPAHVGERSRINRAMSVPSPFAPAALADAAAAASETRGAASVPGASAPLWPASTAPWRAYRPASILKSTSRGSGGVEFVRHCDSGDGGGAELEDGANAIAERELAALMRKSQRRQQHSARAETRGASGGGGSCNERSGLWRPRFNTAANLAASSFAVKQFGAQPPPPPPSSPRARARLLSAAAAAAGAGAGLGQGKGRAADALAPSTPPARSRTTTPPPLGLAAVAADADADASADGGAPKAPPRAHVDALVAWRAHLHACARHYNFAAFDVEAAQCTAAAERTRLLDVLEAGFGRHRDFNELVRTALCDAALAAARAPPAGVIARPAAESAPRLFADGGGGGGGATAGAQAPSAGGANGNSLSSRGPVSIWAGVGRSHRSSERHSVERLSNSSPILLAADAAAAADSARPTSGTWISNLGGFRSSAGAGGASASEQGGLSRARTKSELAPGAEGR